MKEYTKKTVNQTRTFESHRSVSGQAPISDILQTYKNRISGAQPIQGKDTEQAFLQEKRKQNHTFITPPLTHSNLIQGNFPDAYNQERRESQGIDKSQIQMDHMVSQQTLKAFSNTFKVLENLTNDPKTKWELTKEKLPDLRRAAILSKGEHPLFSEAHLINIPKNIVPGLTNQIQEAGFEFDPEVEITETRENSEIVDLTDLSRNQFEMDIVIRELNLIVGSANEILPQTAVDQKKSNLYNEEIDESIAELVEQLTTCFTAMNAMKEPTYHQTVWTDYPTEDPASPKRVKKRPAEWIQDESKITIGGTAAPTHPIYETNFVFETWAIGKDTELEKYTSEIAVNLTIPEATWTHIYERHYLSTFAGDVQPVNTFWKADPYTYLTDTGSNELINELKILLKRSFNFSKSKNIVDIGDEERLTGSHTSKQFFFQLNATSYCNDIQEEEKTINYEVDITIQSIAPQSPDLAFALKAEQLPQATS